MASFQALGFTLTLKADCSELHPSSAPEEELGVQGSSGVPGVRASGGPSWTGMRGLPRLGSRLWGQCLDSSVLLSSIRNLRITSEVVSDSLASPFSSPKPSSCSLESRTALGKAVMEDLLPRSGAAAVPGASCSRGVTSDLRVASARWSS